MNTKEQAIELYQKAGTLIDPNQGVLTLTFFDNSNTKVRLLNMNSNWNAEHFTATLSTFTDNIQNTTEYDIYEIMDIN